MSKGRDEFSTERTIRQSSSDNVSDRVLSASVAMPDLPGGTITFLFTDIEGSTRLWEAHPDLMRIALIRHDAILRAAIEAAQGVVVKTIGDAFMAVFSSARAGMEAAYRAQAALCQEPWPDGLALRVRMGLHTGAAEERDNDYYGPEVNRAARIQAVAHPQQILLSQATYRRLADDLPQEISWMELGLHLLKDLSEPELLYQLCHPDLPHVFPPLESLTHRPNNLRPQPSSFIGREREMAEVVRLLAQGNCLTLVGSGGSGKTRLALQVAAEVLPEFPHGVWVAELASLMEPALVASTVAEALGLREAPDKTSTQVLVEFAKSRTLLLVLDNCEHLLTPCAQLTDALLRSCPQVKVLATSRERLNLSGEQIYRVPSLTVPNPKAATPEEVRRCAATQLFVERALAVKADFALTERNAPGVAQVCQRLDGIPLAIELAAARVKALTVEEIDARLDQRFRLLTGGSRTALPRQQTLRALIDWSYGLLTETEKRLLRRVAVFTGGWTLNAAEAVCADEEGGAADADPIEDWEVLDLLSSLVDKSLVVAEHRSETTRFRLLETVRQYAQDRLAESGESLAVRTRHQAHFLKLAEEVVPKLGGPELAQGLNALETEHDNLRMALNFALETAGATEAILKLAAGLLKYWETRGHFSEGRKYLKALLAQAAGAAPGRALAEAHEAAGTLAFKQGDNPEARAHYEESLRINRLLGDKRGIANSCNSLGSIEITQGNRAAAHAFFNECLALRRELEDKPGVANVFSNMGYLAYEQGDYATARSLYEESLKIQREMGDSYSVAYALMGLGMIAYDQGDYPGMYVLIEEGLAIQRELGDKAGIAYALSALGVAAHEQGDDATTRSLYEESLAISRELEDTYGIAHALSILSVNAYEQGDYERARALEDEAVVIKQEAGDRRGLAYSLRTLGQVAAALQNTELAQARLEESLAIQQELGDKRGMAGALEAFAALAVQRQDLARAARLWGAAAALRAAIGAPASPRTRAKLEAEEAAVKERLEEGSFRRAWDEGYALSLEQAVAYALDQEAS